MSHAMLNMLYKWAFQRVEFINTSLNEKREELYSFQLVATIC